MERDCVHFWFNLCIFMKRVWADIYASLLCITYYSHFFCVGDATGERPCELARYGSVNMHTREWKDGILSKTMRDLGQIPDTHPKWIMLDAWQIKMHPWCIDMYRSPSGFPSPGIPGETTCSPVKPLGLWYMFHIVSCSNREKSQDGDLDANWIESMNSVMDDSRLLTLPSNERIPLKLHMKMIFEARHTYLGTLFWGDHGFSKYIIPVIISWSGQVQSISWVWIHHNMYIHVYIYMIFLHTNIHTWHICIYIHIYIHTHICIYDLYIYICICTYMDIYTHNDMMRSLLLEPFTCHRCPGDPWPELCDACHCHPGWHCVSWRRQGRVAKGTERCSLSLFIWYIDIRRSMLHHLDPSGTELDLEIQVLCWTTGGIVLSERSQAEER